MIDDLLTRINRYQERLAEYFRLQAVAARDHEDEDEDYEPETDEEASETEFTMIPDEIFIDDHAEAINGHRYYSREAKGDAPRRYTVSADNPWYFDIDGVVFSRETGLLVLFPPGKADEYAVPDDERITGIDSDAFAGNQNLKKIIWNNRIRYIGERAFMRCTSVQEITLPACVEYIGEQAFEGCDSLEKAVMDCGIRSIPARTFYHDKALESVMYPESVAEIGRSAFSGCVSLKSVCACGNDPKEWDAVLPQGIREIAPGLFGECGLIRSVCVPDSVEKIGQEAFKNCTALQAVRTDHVKEFGAYCFQNCISLEKTVFGNSTRFLGTDLFSGATGLKSIRFSCSPDFHCAADALPEDMDYSVDTQAYLATARPYICKTLFLECVRNLSKGETVCGNTERTALQILKRNRRKLEDWFLEDPVILTFILNKDILDCNSCVSLIKKTETDNPETAVKIKTHMESHFTARKIAAALTEWEKETVTAQEAEAEKRQLQADREQQSLESLNLSTWVYNCLKRRGINNISDLLAMGEEELRRIPVLRTIGTDEILTKLKNFADR